MLVLTSARRPGFTLDREIGEFMLTHPDLRIPDETREFAINASNERFWEPPVKRYVDECLAGQERAARQGLQHALDRLAGGRGAPHPDARRRVHVPAATRKDPAKAGRLRLLYEANPMAYADRAGGRRGITGRGRMLEVEPDGAAPAHAGDLGSKDEVERIERYHARVRPRRGPAVTLAAVRRALAVPRNV